MKIILFPVVFLAIVLPISAYAQNTTGITTGIYTDPNTGLSYEIPLQGPYCLDFNGDSICDVDFNNGKQIIYDVETQREIEQLNSRDSDNSRDNDNDDNDNDNDNDSNDNDSDDLPQEGGCQEEDDYCDADEGCRSENVDCIDERGFDEDDYDG